MNFLHNQSKTKKTVGGISSPIKYATGYLRPVRFKILSQGITIKTFIILCFPNYLFVILYIIL